MDVRRFTGLALFTILTPPVAVFADSPLPADAGPRSQLIDAISPPIDPQVDRTEQGEQRLDAMSWFGVGKLRESRSDFRGALEAYQKAVELDPDAVAIYRNLVPLAFNLRENDLGLKYAMRLSELDPGDAVRELAREVRDRDLFVAKGPGLADLAVLEGVFDPRHYCHHPGLSTSSRVKITGSPPTGKSRRWGQPR